MGSLRATASTLVAAALLALAPVAAQARTATSAVTFRGAGDDIGAGQPRVFTRANWSVSVRATTGYLAPHPSCAQGGSSAELGFAVAPVRALNPAVRDTAQRPPFREAPQPGIDSLGGGRRCDEITARLDVTGLAVDGSGRRQRRSIVAQRHGERDAPAPLMASTREPPGEEPCPDRRYDPVFVIRGSRGADRIRGGRHGELVLAGAGADRVVAGGGNDCVDGGPGRDRLSGDSGDDVLSGDSGDDVLFGGGGDDALTGGAGDDLLIAGPGRDRLDCGSGRRDVARVEHGDHVRRCERIVRAS